MLNELGITRLLLVLADRVFNSFLTLSESATEGHSDAIEVLQAFYHLLKVIVTSNFASVEAVLAVKGSVRNMLIHQLEGSRKYGAGFDPPLFQLVDSSKLAPLEVVSKVELVSSEEVHLLLDDVYATILRQEVPSPFIYRFLAKVCSIIDYVQVGHPVAEYINENLQMSICQQVLGSSALCSSAETSPFWSAMVYRTIIQDERLSDGSVERRLLISSSPVGQCRPVLPHGEHHAHHTSSAAMTPSSPLL
jgi:hypothetical protein